jgi:hypothetical protein
VSHFLKFPQSRPTSLKRPLPFTFCPGFSVHLICTRVKYPAPLTFFDFIIIIGQFAGERRSCEGSHYTHNFIHIIFPPSCYFLSLRPIYIPQHRKCTYVPLLILGITFPRPNPIYRTTFKRYIFRYALNSNWKFTSIIAELFSSSLTVSLKPGFPYPYVHCSSIPLSLLNQTALSCHQFRFVLGRSSKNRKFL